MEKIYIQEKLMGSPGQVVSFVSDSNLDPPYRAIVKDAPFIQGKSAILTVHAPDRYSRVVVTNGITTLESNPSYLEYVPDESEGLDTLNDQYFYVSESDDRVFYLPTLGEWVVAATKGGIQTQSSINIPSAGDYEISLSYFNAYIDVIYTYGAICKCTNGTVTMTATDADGSYRFTVTNPGDWVIEVSSPDGTQQSTSTVHISSNNEQILVTLNIIDSSLNNNSWQAIKSITEAGQASNYWSVGDSKEILLNGSIGSRSLNNKSVYAILIGINHNYSIESNSKPTLTFQIGSSSSTNGTKIGIYSSSGFYMNSSSTNSGGWKSSYARLNLMSKFKDLLPEDLLSCMVYVGKYTDNNSGSHTGSSNISITYDNMFLLSEKEVFGNVSYSNSYEASLQVQYSYYSGTNASFKKKYRDDSTSTAGGWWLRSPSSTDTTRFCFVTTDGNSSLGSGATNYLIAPAFVIGG